MGAGSAGKWSSKGAGRGGVRALESMGRNTHPVTGKLAVNAHEGHRERPPARVRRVDELAVVPERLHLADLDHLLELAKLELNERVRLAVVRVVLDHDRTRLVDPAARDEPPRRLRAEPHAGHHDRGRHDLCVSVGEGYVAGGVS